jgi:hypothetical protein
MFFCILIIILGIITFLIGWVSVPEMTLQEDLEKIAKIIISMTATIIIAMGLLVLGIASEFNRIRGKE